LGFAQGKEEKGESAEQTAVREVSEECGIEGPSIKWHLTDTYHTYVMNGVGYLKKTIWYNMEFCGSAKLTPQLAEDITEAKWVPQAQLNEYLSNTYPSILCVFKALNLNLAP
jgi:8-oxo-dGTP pyrophosphatase MutT (NUDIX family)